MEAPSSIEKAIDLLFHLHRESSPRGVTEISRALGVPKSSAHRLLGALRHRGLVEQDARGRYLPGIGLVALGLGALEREPLVRAARPVIEAEARRTGETVFVTGVRGGRVVVLDKVEGTGFLRASPRIGAPLPAHATAAGKLVLAFAPGSLETEAAELGSAFTARTCTTPEQLQRELEAVRARGWAGNDEEWLPGLRGVAAPVFVGTRLLGALAVASPAPRMEQLGQAGLARRMVRCAAEVSQRLEGSSGLADASR